MKFKNGFWYDDEKFFFMVDFSKLVNVGNLLMLVWVELVVIGMNKLWCVWVGYLVYFVVCGF